MIRITKFNEVYCQLDADTYTKNKLVRLFRIEEPGYYFNPKYKAGFWDGRRQLYNGGNYIYTGLVPMVIKWANKNNIEVQDNSKIIFNPDDKIEYIKEKVKELKLPFEPRDYQIESVAKCISFNKCAVSSPTSSGKSLIIYMIARLVQQMKTAKSKMVIIVPSRILVKQMYDDFASYSKNDDSWNVEDNCVRISGDFIKDFSKEIIITTYQSLINVDESFFPKIECLFLDECHGAQSYSSDKAKRLHIILNQCTNSRYRFGFTGTFPDEMLFRTTLLKYFVNKFEATDYGELLENNWISNFSINVIKLHHLVNKNGQQYRDELNFIYEDKRRNEFLKKLLLKNKKNQLVLFKEVKQHANKFYQSLIEDPRFKGKHIILLDGDSKVKERDKVKEYIANENDVILLATYKLLGTGWSVNNLHNIIFAAPLKSKQTILQSIGRGLRLLSNSEKNCQIWDIVDKFLYNNTLYTQWKERQRAYESVKFNMKIFDIDDNIKNTFRDNQEEIELF